MDDPWIHSIASSTSAPRASTNHRRRSSFLQQPAEQKADVGLNSSVGEPIVEEDPWTAGPPQATVLRRAQSYSDFYHAVHAYSRKHAFRERRKSLYGRRPEQRRRNPEVDFEEEFHQAESHLLDESYGQYESYQEELELTDSFLDNLLSTTTTTLELLTNLSNSFKSVEVQTEAFRKQCESLMAEQRRLSLLADAIDENVQYYTYLEPMTRRLNAPGAVNLVKSKDFPELLSNLDNCLAYMESNPKHKESATYRSRYRQLLTRGLTLIRVHFTKVLGEIAAEVSKRIQSGQLKETTRSALLYAKFRVPAPELKALGVEIQKRAVPTPDDVDAGREPEYTSLLRELYQSYSATRGRLILPIVTKKMSEILVSVVQSDVVMFSKTCMTFMRGICLDEYELWFEWFETEGALYEFLESMMEPMYDHLRPKVIHETKLEKLCDLCSVIQSRYSNSDVEDDFESSLISPERYSSRKLNFGSLVQPALEDAQTRLVFLAMNVLRDGIENYKSKPEDFKNLQRVNATAQNGVKKGPVLSGTRDRANAAITPATPVTPAPKTPVVVDMDDSESMFSKQLAAEESATSSGRQWYPTLRKAVWLLRRIYRLVNSTVFDDLAHHIVHSTIQSLLTASQHITAKQNPSDGQLFLITHLLHLKQQIVAFDIEFSPPEVEFDFSSVLNPFHELRERGALWNPASWVRLVGNAVVGGALFPKVVENMLDAKAELDGRLRSVINDLVNGYASHIIAPVDPALVVQQQIHAHGTKKDIGTGTSPTSFDPLKAIRTARGLAEKDIPALRAKLESFIDDARTRETLVAAVRDQVLAGYEAFFDAYSDAGPLGGRRVSKKGKAREDEVWSPGLFAEAMERVFLVGRVVGEDEQGDVDGDGASGGSGGVSD